MLERFETHQLTEAEWTHEAHIEVLLLYLREGGLNYTLCKMRPGIITLNQALGGKNTPERGYHETLTLFWAKMGAAFLSGKETQTWDSVWTAARTSSLMDKQLPWQYYSEHRLFSVEARGQWVAPDLKPMPY